MKKFLLPLLFLFTYVSCKNESSSSKTDATIKSQEEKIKDLEARLNKVEESKSTQTHDSENQENGEPQVPVKRKVSNCVFFLCSVTESNNLRVYYTQYYNLEKSGFVDMQLSINRLQDCLKKEIIRTHKQQGVSVDSVDIGVQKFPSQKEAEDWYFRYIKNMKAYPYTSECTDL